MIHEAKRGLTGTIASVLYDICNACHDTHDVKRTVDYTLILWAAILLGLEVAARSRGQVRSNR